MSIDGLNNQVYKDNVEFLSKVTPTKRFTPINDLDNTIGRPGITGSPGPIIPMTISIPNSIPPWSGKIIQFTLLLNPSSKNQGRTFSSAPNYTSTGYIVQLWGPNQDIISSTGRTAVFMVEDEGLAVTFRQSSYAFLNFMALVNAYRNNGYQILSGTATEVNDLVKRIQLIQGVEISYDGDLFQGHFNNFTLDEDAANPFTFNYNFEFIISNFTGENNQISGHFQKGVVQTPENSKFISSNTTDQILNLKHVNETGVKIANGNQTETTQISSPSGNTNGLPNGEFEVSANNNSVRLSLSKNQSYSDSVDSLVSKVATQVMPARLNMEDNPSVMS